MTVQTVENNIEYIAKLIVTNPYGVSRYEELFKNKNPIVLREQVLKYVQELNMPIKEQNPEQNMVWIIYQDESEEFIQIEKYVNNEFSEVIEHI